MEFSVFDKSVECTERTDSELTVKVNLWVFVLVTIGQECLELVVSPDHTACFLKVNFWKVIFELSVSNDHVMGTAVEKRRING